MKARFKKDLENFRNLEDYLVIGFGLHENNSRFYLIADDNFTVGYAVPEHFDIVDDLTENYIRKDSLNSGREFYLEKEMHRLRKDLRSYLELNNPYENIKYFEGTQYPLSGEYKKSMLNEKNLLGRIESTLLFTDHYLYEQFWDDTYREGLEFYKRNSLDDLLEKKIKEPVTIQVIQYKDELLKFIEGAFGAGKRSIEKSDDYARALASLIYALFVKEIASVQKLESFYENCFIIEYGNIYYILSRYWIS